MKNIGYSLDKASADWWVRDGIFRYGSAHVDSYVYCYADAFEYSIVNALPYATKTSIYNFSKIIINNVFPLFDSTFYFYNFLIQYGSSILKFLCEHESKSSKYLIESVIVFVETNYYYHFISFDELVQLFPDDTVDDNSQLEVWVNEVMNANTKAVVDYKGGKTGALNSLKGQVMKLSKGKANINIVGDMLLQKLSGTTKNIK